MGPVATKAKSARTIWPSPSKAKRTWGPENHKIALLCVASFGTTQTCTKIAGSPQLRVNCEFWITQNFPFWNPSVAISILGAKEPPKRVPTLLVHQHCKSFEKSPELAILKPILVLIPLRVLLILALIFFSLVFRQMPRKTAQNTKDFWPLLYPR